MPKRARELSAREVAKLTKKGLNAVGGPVPGLHLKIDGESKSWVLRKMIDGRRRDLGLGSYPLVTLAAARAEMLYVHVNGPREKTVPLKITPVTIISAPGSEYAVESRASTFERCAKAYIALQTPRWKSKKHADQWRSTLETHVFPTIGRLDVADLTAAHLVTMLTPIWATITETATRIRGRIENILDWAKHKGYCKGENPARWSNNLEHELPSPTKLKKRKERHHPALPYTRLGVFMADLRLRNSVSARALEWGILTAARFQEIAGARRREVDLQLKRWTVPAERMKREIEHVVPLSDEAIALFNSLPPGAEADLIFPAPRGGRLSDAALGAMIDGMHEANLRKGGRGYTDPKEGRIATQHGFRSTFRDWAAEVELFERDIVEHAIAHKLKDKAEAAYQRGELLIKRAVIMKRWGLLCRTPEFVAPDLVTGMGKAA